MKSGYLSLKLGFLSKTGGCKFFEWEEPPMCRRSMAIIPGLIRKVNVMEAENEKLKKRLEMMKRTCIVMVVAFVVFQLLSCFMKGWREPAFLWIRILLTEVATIGYV
ncbi:polyketide synthase [Striga asiatica]|uniref:Polyketide synthase n=1 Tax=Striga asiatica TaxID=4170 RepID=A0A5A7RBK6_STRAF|nr:polyketide synthase [Striga asiatica]